MVKVAIVQGRLSPQIGERYQYFPIDGWRQEFAVAAQLGFDGIEWIVSDFSNPLLDPAALDEIASLSRRHHVAITSISLDVLMYYPIFRLPRADSDWLLDRVAGAAAILGTSRMSIPIEENSGIRNPKDAEAARHALAGALEVTGERIPKPCIETDLSPAAARELLVAPGLERLGLLVDLGNIAAYGYAYDDFVSLSAPRIFGLHIKDRKSGLGPTVPLGSGDAEIAHALSAISLLPRLSDVTLQAYRTPHGFVDDARLALNFVRRRMEVASV